MTTTPGKRLIQAAQEAVAIAKGEQAAARITINGHTYVPEAEYRTLLESNAALERERDDAQESVFNAAIRAGEWQRRAEAAERENARLRERLAEADRVIEPFAEVAEWDIGDSEADEDIFRPMDGRNAVARLIRVGHLRAARAYRDKGRE